MKKKQKRKTPKPVRWQCREFQGTRSDDDWDDECEARSAEEAASNFAADHLKDDALSHGVGYQTWVEVRKLSTTHTTRIAKVKVTAEYEVDWIADEQVEAAP